MAAGFRGTYTVLVTPFTPDGGRVDVAALRRLVEFQITEGIHGLIPLGSTGEFLSMTRDERVEVIDAVVDQAGGRVPVLIGTGAEWTRDAVELSREAERMGADGVMIIPPFYSVPTEAELMAHYGAIADAIGLPMMIYNNPSTANVDMLPDTVARLSRIDNVRYIKESTLDVTRVRDIVRLCGDRLTVFAGVLGYESFFIGAQGWVAVCSNVIPRLSAQLFEAALDRNDPAEARAIHERMVDLMWWVGGPRYVAGTKAALEMTGLPVGPPRPPRLPLPADMRPQLRAVLAQLGVVVAEAGVSTEAGSAVAGLNLSARAYGALSRMIHERRLKGGEAILEARLAADLSISRTPLREALQRLEGEGLVTKSASRSYTVRRVDLAEYLHSLKVREVLEPEAAVLAAGTIPGDTVAAVRSEIAALVPASYLETAHWRADAHLHDLFIDACGNPVMRDVLKGLRATTHLFEVARLQDRLAPDNAEHLAILDALEAGDARAARRAVQTHIRSLTRYALAALR